MTDVAETGSAGREDLHREAESRVRSFRYAKPESLGDHNKALVRMCASDILKAHVQVIEDGGENNLHYHEDMDDFWMVLRGGAAFYGPGDALIGTYGPLEGLLMPRWARYWFAKESDEDLELLQVAVYEDDAGANRRVDLSGDRPRRNRNLWLDGQKGNAPLDRPKKRSTGPAPGAAADPGLEARHREAEGRVQGFAYRKPKALDAPKGIVRLCRSDILQGLVQVIRTGGENNLHYHEGMDSYWMVLRGRAAFYGPGDALIGEYGPLEGLLMPRRARYWFAKASDDEDLELLQVIAYERDAAHARRIDSSKRRLKAGSTPWFDARAGNAVLDRSQR